MSSLSACERVGSYVLDLLLQRGGLCFASVGIQGVCGIRSHEP